MSLELLYGVFMSDNYFIFFLLWGKLVYVQRGIFLSEVEFEYAHEVVDGNIFSSQIIEK